MRSTQSVSSHRFQHFQLALERARIDGRSQGPEIMMITGAANLYRLTIEQEAFVDIENKRANAERGLVAIHRAAVLLQFGNDFVEVGPLVRPQSRMGYGYRLPHFDLPRIGKNIFLDRARDFAAV